jgi:hypothetical protein
VGTVVVQNQKAGLEFERVPRSCSREWPRPSFVLEVGRSAKLTPKPVTDATLNRLFSAPKSPILNGK